MSNYIKYKIPIHKFHSFHSTIHLIPFISVVFCLAKPHGYLLTPAKKMLRVFFQETIQWNRILTNIFLLVVRGKFKFTSLNQLKPCMSLRQHLIVEIQHVTQVLLSFLDKYQKHRKRAQWSTSCLASSYLISLCPTALFSRSTNCFAVIRSWPVKRYISPFMAPSCFSLKICATNLSVNDRLHFLRVTYKHKSLIFSGAHLPSSGRSGKHNRCSLLIIGANQNKNSCKAEYRMTQTF